MKERSDDVKPILLGRGNGTSGDGVSIENKLENLATKEDVQNLGVWMFSVILGA